MSDTDVFVLMASVIALIGMVSGYAIGHFGGQTGLRARVHKPRR